MVRIVLSDGGRGCSRLAAGDRLCLWWTGPSLGAVSRVSSPVVVGGHSSFGR